ncbi:enoyl-CoA hydratase/isomerase family protein [Cytobacillus sp. Hz8]|uniref:enoyl-CoA hydratase/isomerase family protein n=1 Tax=Cytobacillus sp. Hz8 TaxID=3347168 RepID=UPI0035D968BF
MEPYTINEEPEGYILFTINRPEKRNAINDDVMNGLRDAIDRTEESDAKALVITGAGDRAFCSGGDLSVFHELRTEEQAYSMLSKMAKILYRLLTLSKPTVAVINGAAVGGGCEIATACDFRIAQKGIKAGFVQGTLAITTGWGGGTMLLEKIPTANALKMLMEARVFTSDELVDLGFVQSTYEGAEENRWREVLAPLLHIESEVLQAYKNLLLQKWTDSQLWERMEKEVRGCAILWEGEKHHRQVELFRNRK